MRGRSRVPWTAPAGRGPCSWSPKSTASAQPMIGWMPAPAILSENSSAPNMLSVSVSASAGWRSALASSASRAIGQRALEQRVGRMHVQVHEAWVGRLGSHGRPLASGRRLDRAGESRRDSGRRGWSMSTHAAATDPRSSQVPRAAVDWRRPPRRRHAGVPAPTSPAHVARGSKNTCTHTASIPMNSEIDASAAASSTKARNMTDLPWNERGT